MGRLIAIDGVDASGKQTHTSMLYEKLIADGYNVRKISFPAYESPSSELVKMYLSGKFGDKPEDVNAYAASSFFAADRFSSFRTDWKEFYEKEDTIIIADRYTSSNMIHQASKIDDVDEKNKFLDWLFELEFDIYEIPKPDLTFFLDMPVQYAKKLMEDRENKFDNTQSKDIHERNREYLEKSYENACYIANKYSWEHILCVENGEIRTIEDINDEMYDIVKKMTSR
ncbi:MAG: thymidylate kinase [Clostridia bacterium]|nr:thymidylate kinase [Clostridia bacterium]